MFPGHRKLITVKLKFLYGKNAQFPSFHPTLPSPLPFLCSRALGGLGTRNRGHQKRGGHSGAVCPLLLRSGWPPLLPASASLPLGDDLNKDTAQAPGRPSGAGQSGLQRISSPPFCPPPPVRPRPAPPLLFFALPHFPSLSTSRSHLAKGSLLSTIICFPIPFALLDAVPFPPVCASLSFHKNWGLGGAGPVGSARRQDVLSPAPCPRPELGASLWVPQGPGAHRRAADLGLPPGRHSQPIYSLYRSVSFRGPVSLEGLFVLAPELSRGGSEPMFALRRREDCEAPPFRSQNYCFPPGTAGQLGEPSRGPVAFRAASPSPTPPGAVASVGVSRAAPQGSECALAVGL